jgi:hypothetical protein
VIIVDVVSTAVTAHLFSTNGSVPTANDEFETIVLQSEADKGDGDGGGGGSSSCFISAVGLKNADPLFLPFFMSQPF